MAASLSSDYRCTSHSIVALNRHPPEHNCFQRLATLRSRSAYQRTEAVALCGTEEEDVLGIEVRNGNAQRFDPALPQFSLVWKVTSVRGQE
jgi:hypothetical protein